MSLQILIPWFAGAMAISIASMVSGAWSGRPLLVSAGAMLFALAAVATCWHINRPYFRDPRANAAPDALAFAVRRNARLLALTYVWGGIALFALYKGTGLRWQHGLQYAIGMTVIGFIVIGWVFHSWRPGSRLVSPIGLKFALWATMVHAAAAVGGLIFLIGSGKLMSTRGDWAANQVFLAGGLAVVGMSVIAILTHLRLSRAGSGAPAQAEVEAGTVESS